MFQQTVYQVKNICTKNTDIFKKSYPLNMEGLCVLTIKVGTFLALLVPLVVSFGLLSVDAQIKVFVFRTLIEVMAIAWVWLLLFRSSWRKSWTNLRGMGLLFFLLILSFILSAAISTIFGVDPSYSFFSNVQRMTGLLTFLHLFIFFAIIFTVFHGKNFLTLFKFSLIISLAVSFSAIIENHFNIIGNMERIQGAIGHPSFLATYLIFNIFFALILLMESQRFQEKIIYIFSSSLLIITLFLTGTRGGIIGFSGGVLVSLVLSVFLKKINFKKNFVRNPYVLGTILLLLLGTLLIIFTYANKESAWVTKTPLNTISRINLQEGQRRFLVWSLSYHAFKEKPLFGWGPENFEVAYFKYYDPRLYEGEGLSEKRFDRAHNIIIDTGITQGIIGLLVYLGIFFIAILTLFSFLGTKKSKEKLEANGFLRAPSLVAILLIGLLSAYFLQNLFVFDTITAYIPFFLTLAFILAMASSYQKGVKKNIILERIQKKIPIFTKYFNIYSRSILFLLAAVLLSLSVWTLNLRPAISSFYFSKAIDLANLQRYDDALIFYRKSFELFHLQGPETDEPLVNTTVALFKAKKIMPAWDFFYLTEEKQRYISPVKLDSYMFGSKIYGAAESENPAYFDIAVKTYEKAIKLSPKQLFLYYDLTELYSENGMYDEAYKTLERVRSFDPPENPETSRHTFEVALREGDKEKASGELNIFIRKSLDKDNITDKNDVLYQALLESTRKAIVMDKIDLLKSIIVENYKAEMEKYVAGSPKPDVLFKIVLIELNIKEKEKAKTLAQKIVEIDPSSKKDIDGVLQIIDSMK